MKLNKYDKEMIDKASDVAGIYNLIKDISETQSDLISKREMIKNNHELKDVGYTIRDEEEQIVASTDNEVTMLKVLGVLIEECDNNIKKYMDELKMEMYELISYSSDDDEYD